MTKEELIDYWKSSGLIYDEALLKAFIETDRNNFILSKYKNQVYEDIPLPIGEEATISQPSTIMIMLQALEIKKHQKILEIGTGSGYTACLISKIISTRGKVFTFEIEPKLAEFAQENIKKEKRKNIEVICKDGSRGLKKESPFDRILINAATEKIPQQLISQLKNNGILIAPVGPPYTQKMIKLVKINNELKKTELGNFIFVRLRK